MTTNRDERPVFELSSEQLNGIFARTTAELVSQRDARRRAEAWPHAVGQALLAAANRIRDLDARVTALAAGRG